MSTDRFIHMVCTHGYMSHAPHMKWTDAYIMYII